MSARPTHDLSIKTGEYTDRQTGEQKARWLRIGSVFRHDDGSTSIKLDCLPLGLPDWNGWVNVFPREDLPAGQARRRDEVPTRNAAPPRSTPRPPQSEPAWSDDIPF